MEEKSQIDFGANPLIRQSLISMLQCNAACCGIASQGQLEGKSFENTELDEYVAV